ncbi:MAG: hypothetical protein ACYC35_10355 [Pirellulales bacterium]
MSIVDARWPLALLLVTLFSGCDQASGPAPPKPAPATSAAPPPPTPVTQSAAGQPQPAPTTTTTPSGASASAPQPTPTTAQTAGPLIQLSAGVALPQTGPEGTFMSFSVDYQFTQGAPGPTNRYVWVIAPAQGNPMEEPATLQAQGTLQVFTPRLRPENGPFRAHLEQLGGQPPRRTVSNTVDLQ